MSRKPKDDGVQFPHLNRPASVEEAFAAAVTLHQNGRLEQAGDIYTKILSLQPDHPDALHLSGVIASQGGDFRRAAELIRRAIEKKPDTALFHLNLGNALHGQGLTEEAAAAYGRALELDPDFAEAHFGIANTVKDQGRLEEAETAYRRALEHRPSYPEAYNNLAGVLKGQGRLEEAIETYQRARDCRPDDAEPHFNLGNLYQDSGRPEDAAKAYGCALEQNPRHPGALFNLGAVLKEQGKPEQAASVLERLLEARPDDLAARCSLGDALHDLGRLEEAEAAYRRALKAEPGHPDALNNLGAILKEHGKLEEAAETHGRALEIKPDDAGARYNLANALHDLGRFDESIAEYRRALEIRPGFVEALNNLASALYDNRQAQEAIAAYDEALSLLPGDPDILANQSMAHLLLGDFANGWEKYEWRLRRKGSKAEQRDLPQPRWRGEDLDGRAILLHTEQGLGDALQFIRYAPLVAGDAGRVIVECQPTLKGLFESVGGIDQIVGQGEPLPPFDVHCPLMSLPLCFGTSPETIPAAVPYVSADDGLSEAWRRRLEDEESLKVGLVWAGNPRKHDLAANIVDRRRSVPLADLARLGEIDGVRFYSLQKGKAAEDTTGLQRAMGMVDHTVELIDFADTAALTANLDLVISVDTSVAHLAGALGKPVWLLSRFDGCWRWLLEGETSPWYPTLRLFRQSTPADWPETVARLAGELERAASGDRGRLSPRCAWLDRIR